MTLFPFLLFIIPHVAYEADASGSIKSPLRLFLVRLAQVKNAGPVDRSPFISRVRPGFWDW